METCLELYLSQLYWRSSNFTELWFIRLDFDPTCNTMWTASEWQQLCFSAQQWCQTHSNALKHTCIEKWNEINQPLSNQILPFKLVRIAKTLILFFHSRLSYSIVYLKSSDICIILKNTYTVNIPINHSLIRILVFRVHGWMEPFFKKGYRVITQRDLDAWLFLSLAAVQ